MNAIFQGHKSILALEVKLKKHFRALGEECVVFCDNCDILWPSGTLVNVVFLGTALRDLQYISLWPGDCRYKLWVLNYSLRAQISHYLGIEEKRIGVIDRYQLFPAHQKELPFPLLKDGSRFIYSGRASRLKNVDITHQFIAALSDRLGLKFEFLLCGPYFKEEDYLSRILPHPNVSITGLGDLGEDWVKQINTMDNYPILIHLSTDPLDDFGVSVAQWQQYGLPLIVGALGPYSELRGENVFKIKKASLLMAAKSRELRYGHALADEFLSGACDQEPKAFSFMPECIDPKNLQEKIDNVEDDMWNLIAGLNAFNANTFTWEVLNV